MYVYSLLIILLVFYMIFYSIFDICNKTKYLTNRQNLSKHRKQKNELVMEAM